MRRDLKKELREDGEKMKERKNEVVSSFSSKIPSDLNDLVEYFMG